MKQQPLPLEGVPSQKPKKNKKERLKRLDQHPELKAELLPYCRLKSGDIWEDPVRGHRVGVLDATSASDIQMLADDQNATLAINDPPYNVVVGNANTDNLFKMGLDGYLEFSQRWIQNTVSILADDAHFYVWLGADYRDNFQPLPDFILLMRNFSELSSRNIITVRNQRGYGTQHNWMWVRQELLHYVKGKPPFKVVYTEIPKVLKGYYKTVRGRKTENIERSKSNTIRPGNVWLDIQQVFYRLEENVSGCYAQKPLTAIERIIESSSTEDDTIVDFFAHSGTTLIAGERLHRTVFTSDVDPVFAEITIRRLEHYRATGKTGWQWRSPFPEI